VANDNFKSIRVCGSSHDLVGDTNGLDVGGNEK